MENETNSKCSEWWWETRKPIAGVDKKQRDGGAERNNWALGCVCVCLIESERLISHIPHGFFLFSRKNKSQKEKQVWTTGISAHHKQNGKSAQPKGFFDF